MSRHSTIVLGLFCLVVSGIGSASAQYYVTNLGTPAGTTSSSATAINDHGQVVGWSTASSGAVTSFLYSGGAISMLDVGGHTGAYAYGINNNGLVTGEADNDDSGLPQGFIYNSNDGSTTDLGGLSSDDGFYSFAKAINIHGAVAGYANSDSSTDRAFLYTSGAGMQDLGTLDNSVYTHAQAYGINDSGQVVGWSATTYGGNGHAFLYTPGSGMTDLSMLSGGTGSSAVAINNAGQVAGNTKFLPANQDRAFLYSSGSLTDLGTLGGVNSDASGIASDGRVVGSSNTAGGAVHAFLYSDGTMADLNNALVSVSGWTFSNAAAINSSGQIVGNGTAPGGLSAAFLLTPALPGDANLDGTVNGGDLNTVLAHYNQVAGVNWTLGDFDHNGTVNGGDLNTVLAHYNQHVSLGAAVPEPGTLGMLALAVMGALAWKGWRKR